MSWPLSLARPAAGDIIAWRIDRDSVSLGGGGGSEGRGGVKLVSEAVYSLATYSTGEQAVARYRFNTQVSSVAELTWTNRFLIF